MSLAVDRYRFIEAMRAEGVPPDVARLVMRDACTLDRLAVAACNGDWPCDDGERKTAPGALCEAFFHPSVLSKRKWCPGCQAAVRIAKRLAPYGCEPKFNGDPRGYVVAVKVPSGRSDYAGAEVRP